MGEDNTVKMFTGLFQITDIGDDGIDTQITACREAHTTINHDLVIAKFVNIHIFGNTTDTTERNQLKLRHNFFIIYFPK